jgi:hypothetical protein
MAFENYQGLGDVIECYVVHEIKRLLEGGDRLAPPVAAEFFQNGQEMTLGRSLSQAKLPRDLSIKKPPGS